MYGHHFIEVMSKVQNIVFGSEVKVFRATAPYFETLPMWHFLRSTYNIYWSFNNFIIGC